MDDDGGIRNWAGYYNPAMKGLGLQLMPGMAVEHDTTKPLLSSNGAFLHHHHHQQHQQQLHQQHHHQQHHRQYPVPEPQLPMEYIREGWIPHRETKLLHVLPVSQPNYTTVLDNPNPHTLQMLQPHDLSNDDKASLVDEASSVCKDAPPKKRQGRQPKTPKPKKPKKPPAPRDETSVPRRRAGRVSAGIVINGIDLDISGLPTPVCSCTGTPQPCYRWGIGGWQSACCTTSMSMYPLPMSTKRRGARIAGRKMSQGAFKKVLEKLAGEGYNLSNPIDLKAYWAKHGTNKFVTIR